MYAGELLFLLIALMGMAAPALSFGGGAALWAGHVLTGTLWALFHIFIVILQVFNNFKSCFIVCFNNSICDD
ncbi:MAG TPA: hypothetical protein PLV89_12455 [Treponemataceae bacterium]|nr:hypothetical protein [Treponemataceae bacterium]